MEEKIIVENKISELQKLSDFNSAQRMIDELSIIKEDAANAMHTLKNTLHIVKNLPDLNELGKLNNLKTDVALLETKLNNIEEDVEFLEKQLEAINMKASNLFLDLLDMSTVEQKLNEVSDVARNNERPYSHEMAIIVSRFATRCEKMIFGTINGVPLNENDNYYNNNFKYYYDNLVKNGLVKPITE